MENKIVVLDGAMGTMLQKSGLEVGGIPEELNIKDPQTVVNIHKKYIESGAEIIYTNTFGANRKKLRGLDVSKIVNAAIKNAKEAAEGTSVKTALDIGPIGEMLEPAGVLKFEEAYEIFKEIIIAADDKTDFIVIETMTDLYEVKAAVLAAKENSKLPIFVTMTFEEDGRTFSGVSVENFANVIGGMGVSAIGINCSLGPVQIFPIAKRLSEITDVDLIIKPNAGLPNMDGGYDISVSEFLSAMSEISKLGVKYLGGCCGTDENYIRFLSSEFSGKNVAPRNFKKITGPSSGTKMLINSGFKIVGERLNPTGKKKFQDALKNEDMSYFISKAVEQVDAGAEILDLNVGFPGVDEADLQRKIVKSLQSVLDTPLQIDSTNIEALEAALRVYNGKAIINSVNGEDERIEKIMPLAKKYNAQIIGLTIDERGIPETVEDRIEIAKKIIKSAEEYGISKDDIYIDCLTLTISSNPESAVDTLNAIRILKRDLGVKTALGVSNISFGLPNRELINQSFLTMAMYEDLNLAIVNPNSELITNAIYGFKLLNNEKDAAQKFIEKFGADTKKTVLKKNTEYDIKTAVYKGMSDKVKEKVKEMLETKDELEIVDTELIPALDVVGEDFEKGNIFLPQLIKSADAAQAGFSVINQSIIESGKKSISKGDVVVATVKGDVHDIGKNISKVILENYGFNVIDLGKDVDISRILEVIEKKDIKLVGLSALMTTTLENMKETIKEIRKLDRDVKIMVGGAVLTSEYSKIIGADYYVKDSKADVEVANKIFGGNDE